MLRHKHRRPTGRPIRNAGIWGAAPKRSAGIWGNTTRQPISRGGFLGNSNWKTGAVWGHSTMGSNTWTVFGKQKSKMRTSQLISPKNIKAGIAIGKQGVGAAKGAYGAGKKVYGGAKFIYGKIQQRRANVKTAKQQTRKSSYPTK